MKDYHFPLQPLRRLALALAAGSLGLLTSCYPPQNTASSAPPVPESGRFQIVTAAESGRGVMLFLVDTKDGSTWIYRGPQGNAINGFWSNIPKLQVADAYWNHVLSSMFAPEPGIAPGATNQPPTQPTAQPDTNALPAPAGAATPGGSSIPPKP